jgi:hypothetical protein
MHLFERPSLCEVEMDPRHRRPATLSKDTRMSGTSLVQQASFLSRGCSLARLTKAATG